MSEQPHAGKSKEELLAQVGNYAPSSGRPWEELKAAIQVRLAQDLETSLSDLTGAVSATGSRLSSAMEAANRASTRLGTVGIVLNVVLVIATAVIAWGTIVLASKGTPQ